MDNIRNTASVLDKTERVKVVYQWVALVHVLGYVLKVNLYENVSFLVFFNNFIILKN